MHDRQQSKCIDVLLLADSFAAIVAIAFHFFCGCYDVVHHASCQERMATAGQAFDHISIHLLSICTEAILCKLHFLQ